jgi:hypothetical protein
MRGENHEAGGRGVGKLGLGAGKSGCGGRDGWPGGFGAGIAGVPGGFDGGVGSSGGIGLGMGELLVRAGVPGGFCGAATAVRAVPATIDRMAMVVFIPHF